jgi:hypothetical protein
VDSAYLSLAVKWLCTRSWLPTTPARLQLRHSERGPWTATTTVLALYRPCLRPVKTTARTFMTSILFFSVHPSIVNHVSSPGIAADLEDIAVGSSGLVTGRDRNLHEASAHPRADGMVRFTRPRRTSRTTACGAPRA